MDESVKTLVAEAFPDVERELFGRAFSLDEACELVAGYMFRRYGVSSYQCSKAVKEAMTGQLDAHPRLLRVSAGEDLPGWKPAG
jgi:hypothetical protein